MKKAKILTMLGIMLAMGLVACSGAKSSDEPSPSSQDATPSSQDQAKSSDETPNTSSQEQPSSSQNSQPSSEEQPPVVVPDSATMSATGIDIVVKENVVYAHITGTISGFPNADTMKMAFGLVTDTSQGGTAEYVYGSAEPADADYKLVPTVDSTAETFAIDVDLSDVTWTAGTYTAMIGPKGYYSAVVSSDGTYGTGKTVVGGYRISIRSHNGTIAADELPPLELTISRVEVEDDKVYHIVGGALNETKLTKENFLASHPYMQYECVDPWKQNVLGSSSKTDLVTVSVDESGNALIKTNITSLTAASYNIKINLTEDKDVDTKMDAVIDTSANPVEFKYYNYVCYADSSQSDKDHIYGNCGLIISLSGKYINEGEKVADLQPVASKPNEIAYELYAADCDGQNNPSYTNSNSRLGKNSIYVDSWDITGVTSGQYEVYVKGAYSSGNGNSYWSGALNVEHGKDSASSTNNGNPYNPAYRYNFQAGDEDPVDAVSEQTYADSGLSGKEGGDWTKEAMAKIMISETMTTFKMTNVNNGYSIWVYALRLVRVGNYVKPATPVSLTDNKMRIEAEDFHVQANRYSGTVTANEELSNGSYIKGLAYHTSSWWGTTYTTIGQLDYYVKITEAMSLKVVVHAQSNKTESATVMELLIDGEVSQELACADTWIDIESTAIDFAVGQHTISLKAANSATVDIDYIELVKQAA